MQTAPALKKRKARNPWGFCAFRLPPSPPLEPLQRDFRGSTPDQIIPNTTAARNPNDMIAASTFSLIFSSIGASLPEHPAVLVKTRQTLRL